jgi:hypothetical protein
VNLPTDSLCVWFGSTGLRTLAILRLSVNGDFPVYATVFAISHFVAVSIAPLRPVIQVARPLQASGFDDTSVGSTSSFSNRAMVLVLGCSSGRSNVLPRTGEEPGAVQVG